MHQLDDLSQHSLLAAIIHHDFQAMTPGDSVSVAVLGYEITATCHAPHAILAQTVNQVTRTTVVLHNTTTDQASDVVRGLIYAVINAVDNLHMTTHDPPRLE